MVFISSSTRRIVYEELNVQLIIKKKIILEVNCAILLLL